MLKASYYVLEIELRSGKEGSRQKRVLRAGLEPTTSSVLTMCDNQLHHPSTCKIMNISLYNNVIRLAVAFRTVSRGEAAGTPSGSSSAVLRDTQHSTVVL